jgi:hypothetical protein
LATAKGPVIALKIVGVVLLAAVLWSGSIRAHFGASRREVTSSPPQSSRGARAAGVLRSFEFLAAVAAIVLAVLIRSRPVTAAVILVVCIMLAARALAIHRRRR